MNLVICEFADAAATVGVSGVGLDYTNRLIREDVFITLWGFLGSV